MEIMNERKKDKRCEGSLAKSLVLAAFLFFAHLLLLGVTTKHENKLET
jgi:preprotein translocase subunit SecG